METQINTYVSNAHESKQIAVKVERIVLDSLAGSMQPGGLAKEAAEKQDAENHNDCDDDNLN